MCVAETCLTVKGRGVRRQWLDAGRTRLVRLQGNALLRKCTATGMKGVTLNRTGHRRVFAFSVLLQLDLRSAELCLWSDNTWCGL